MASLLDFLNSDDAALGLGLLAASGPTTDPNQTGLGRVLAGGVGYAQQVKRANAELALKEAAARRQARIEEFGLSLLSGGPVGGAGGAGDTPALLQPSAAGGGSTGGAGGGAALGGVNRQALGADFLFNNGKNVGTMINERSTPKWVDAGGGNFINTNQPGFGGGFQARTWQGRDGQNFISLIGPDGMPQTMVAPGSVDAFRQFQDQANLSRAATTPGSEFIGKDGRMYPRTQAEQLGIAAPGAATPPAARPAPLIGGPRAGAAPVPTAQPGVMGNFEGNPSDVAMAIGGIADPQERANAMAALGQQMRAQGNPQNLALIGPGAAPQPGQPLPVQTTVGGGDAVRGATAFSPAEVAQQQANQKAAESVAGQVGPTLAAGQEQATNAVQSIGTAQRLISAVDSGKAFTGKAAGVKLTAEQWAESLGLGGKDSAERIAATRNAIQELAKLTLQGRQSMRGQGAITEGESQLAQQAISGNITYTPAELKELAHAADRSARFQYKTHVDRLSSMAASNPAMASQISIFAPPPLPDASTAPAPSAAPAAGGLPAGWTVRVK
jgi:hypothetical protein